MNTASFKSEDNLCLYVLLGFIAVFIIYLAVIAWVLYEFLHQPEAPSTRIIYPVIGERILSKTRQVRYFRTKIIPR